MVEEITRANERFYRAFESLDIDRMAEVWLHDDSVKCIHPGWQAKFGWEEVRDSWITIFSNTRYMEFDISDVHVLVLGDCAWVICTETLSSVTGNERMSGKVQAPTYMCIGARPG